MRGMCGGEGAGAWAVGNMRRVVGCVVGFPGVEAGGAPRGLEGDGDGNSGGMRAEGLGNSGWWDQLLTAKCGGSVSGMGVLVVRSVLLLYRYHCCFFL